jgi:hypothetical protein
MSGVKAHGGPLQDGPSNVECEGIRGMGCIGCSVVQVELMLGLAVSQNPMTKMKSGKQFEHLSRLWLNTSNCPPTREEEHGE